VGVYSVWCEWRVYGFVWCVSGCVWSVRYMCVSGVCVWCVCMGVMECVVYEFVSVWCIVWCVYVYGVCGVCDVMCDVYVM